jgi:carbon-monoxide dehydrogenase large subunit
VTAFLAKTLHRPVRWVEKRTENIVSMGHGRGILAHLQAAVQKDGTILGLKAEIFADLGSYPGELSLLSALSTAEMISGCYAIPAIKTTLKGVVTSAAPTGAYRGAGRPEASYCIERTIEAIAGELGLDPVEVRKRNFIAPEAFPYTTATGAQYDSGAYAHALDVLLEKADYQGLRAEQARLREQGRYIGIGLSFYIESCAVGGQQMSGRPDTALTRITPQGKIVVDSASVDSGQGHATTYAYLAATEFAVPVEQVEVRIGDSPQTHSLGTFGSRSLVVGGSAVTLSARELKQKALLLAAHLLEVAEGDLVLSNGRVQVAGAPGKFYTLGQLAAFAEDVEQREQYPENVRDELLQGLCSTQGFEPEDVVYPFGAHLAVVEVERETGEVRVQRYIGVDDCGKVILPMLVEGQLHGALAQGIGQALYEQVLYEEHGQVLSSTLMDYAVPLATKLPTFELSHTVTPSPRNVLGAKGVGEAGCIGAPTAVTNAVLDALAPLGVTALDMPLTAEKVWRAMNR